MLKNIIHKAMLRRHFWRQATFDELSEVYIAMSFRSFALGLIGIFVPVYILKSGFGLTGVIQFFICFFAVRVLMDFLAAHTVARFGPKHTLLIGYIIQIIAAGTFSFLGTSAASLLIPAAIWGAANSFTFIALHVDFSKIKHINHGGKELGYLNALERVGGMLGPVTGGLLATFYGPQVLFLVAVVVLLIGLVPLFKTAEPVKTHQKLFYSRLDISSIKRDFLSYSFYSIENNLCLVLWPAFLVLFIFSENVYGNIGGLASIGFMISIASAYFVGKLVDGKKGGLLLRVSSFANACVYGLRPFVSGIAGVLAINIMNEALTVGYRIPYIKGVYDASDEHEGLRIVYLSSLEAFGSLVKSITWIQLLVLSQFMTDFQLLTTGFAIAGLCSILINTQGFKALGGR